ncbi:serine/arginine repetitive matrix protein 1 isoform X1 [Tanacetum coccineum]
MSGGFFRGTTADQDTRFSNKHAKLLKSQKFHPELEHLVDMTKVKMDVMRPWIAHRVTELLGFEDEVLINFIYGLLEEKVVNGKEIQISLTGFMEKNTGKFMKELWTHLLSAQENDSGVPQQFLDAKEEETRKKQEDTDRITRELKRAKEKEGRELDQERTRRTRDREDHGYDHERVKMDREVDNVKADEKYSPKETPRSRSPIRRRSRSPIRRRSRSPIRQRSRSPISRRSRSPIRRRARSPIRRRSPFRRRSPSPYRHRSQSPVSPSRNVSLSPSPVRRRSPSPMRRRNQRAQSTPRHQSSSPVRRKVTNPGQQRSPSPGSMSSSPSGRISLSPKRDTPPSMLRRGSPKRQQRSPSESPRDGHVVTQRNAPDCQMPRKETAEHPTESRKASSFAGNLPPPPPLPKGRRVPALSPAPYNSPPGSVSPPAARRTPSKERLSGNCLLSWIPGSPHSADQAHVQGQLVGPLLIPEVLQGAQLSKY